MAPVVEPVVAPVVEPVVEVPVVEEPEITHGTLSITVVEGNLTNDTEFFGEMDPYVKFEFGDYDEANDVYSEHH